MKMEGENSVPNLQPLPKLFFMQVLPPSYKDSVMYVYLEI